MPNIDPDIYIHERRKAAEVELGAFALRQQADMIWRMREIGRWNVKNYHDKIRQAEKTK